MTQHDRPAARRRMPEFMAPFSRPPFALATFLAIILVMVVFTLLPSLDIMTSGFFRMPVAAPAEEEGWTCAAFALSCHSLLRPIRNFLHGLPLAMAVLLLIVTLWRAWKLRDLLELQVLRYSAAFWAFVIGPGILVNSVLKPLWARPRPYHLELNKPEFADYVFMPVGHWGGACESNCSFPSGEASGLFWLLCATAILPARYRRTAFFVFLPVAIFGSLLRVAFGGHFLSDVTVGALLSILSFSLCAIIAAAIARRWGKAA